jgi:hypothetical protein
MALPFEWGEWGDRITEYYGLIVFRLSKLDLIFINLARG